MNDQTTPELMMIGLHRMAAERGDGLIPELLALYAARQEMVLDRSNVVAFPEKLASPACTHPGRLENDNVIAFEPRLAQKSRSR